MDISREAFLKMMTLTGVGFVMGNTVTGLEKEILVPDHFLWGCADLQEGIRLLKEKTGVQAMIGGKHLDVGTHNALLSLGDKVYLEIIAPDPEADTLVDDYQFLKEFKEPTLFYWAAHTEAINSLLMRINKLGLVNSGIKAGSRKKPDGTILEWESLSIDSKNLMPFFIQWGKQSRHPSVDAPKGCHIHSFWLESETPEILVKEFAQLDIQMPVKFGQKELLHLKLNTPKGIVVL